ncbi:hypothetical protein GH714_014456 [Hevea brasiliensis]|uniref:Protein OS-9 homolog n=1 Tax=Hevea brasiliensis TaxID=3981 RepID=A0A6A6MDK5_HEVBR|nr:hypothetical protein GH714_014456 [Hevea brasiliensis]
MQRIGQQAIHGPGQPYSWHNGLLCYKNRVVVPPQSPIIHQLLKEFHDSPIGGHSGVLRTYKRLAQQFYWPSMHRSVKDHVASCEVCQGTKVETLAPAGLLQPLPIPCQVWDDVTMDFIDGLPTLHGMNSILVAVDRLSKSAHFVALAHPYTAKLVAGKFIEYVVKLHGMPKSIITDRDPIFVSRFWPNIWAGFSKPMQLTSHVSIPVQEGKQVMGDVAIHHWSISVADDDQESVVMPDKNGQNYLCYLPKVEKVKSGKPVNQLNVSSMIVETEKRVKLKTPDELLEVLKDRCFIRQEGWWSYEFCYQKKLRQVHLEDDKVVQEFVLGVYDEEATAAYNQNLSDVSTLKDPRSKDASQRYHAHQYTNGTMCDLTNQPRETEVRFVCSEPRAMISSITELSTCKYALTIQCPMLCKHPLFQEERPVWHTINCNVLPKDTKETKAEKDKAEDKQVIMATDMEIHQILIQMNRLGTASRDLCQYQLN